MYYWEKGNPTLKIFKKWSAFFDLRSKLRNNIAVLYKNDEQHVCPSSLLSTHQHKANVEHKLYRSELIDAFEKLDGVNQHVVFDFVETVCRRSFYGSLVIFVL